VKNTYPSDAKKLTISAGLQILSHRL